MTTSEPVRVSLRRDDGVLLPPFDSLVPAFGRGPYLVVVPHDDDLVLGMGMTAARAAAEGIAVHVAVATDGGLGYVHPQERATLVETRSRELDASITALGLDLARVHRLGFPDGSLSAHTGCRPPELPPTLAQKLVKLMREIRPSTVFVCTATDLHPDHRASASETDIACFWASSRIWLELGEPITLPARFQYAVYCPFSSPPEFEVALSPRYLEQKIGALRCYASQGVIEPMIEQLKSDGPFEYIARSSAPLYRPRTYSALFERPIASRDAGRGYREDCRMALEVVRGFSEQGTGALARLMRDAGKPLLIVGEGSSQLFPARFAAWLASRGGLGGRVLVAGGREAAAMQLDAYRLAFVSNSGDTRELVDLARVMGRDAVAVLGRTGGALEGLVDEHVCVLPRPESVVAATASVFAQALTLGLSVLSAAGYRAPLTRLESEVQRVLELDVRQALPGLPRVERVFWADPGHGAGAELALKCMEVCGITAVHAPGNLLLHGIEETLCERDLVVWLDPAPEDRARRDAITRSSGATSVLLGGAESALGLSDIGPFTPLVQLLVGYRIVEELALSHGRDPDRPRRARKVGNPA